MNAIERLEAIERSLSIYGAALTESMRDGGQQEESPAIAFQRAFAFDQNTLRSVALALLGGFHELSARMFWAAREPRGWQLTGATLALTRAGCTVGAADEQIETEALARQIVEILHGARARSPDDFAQPKEK